MPEWYFLPFYAILRVDPEQAAAACIAMFGSIARAVRAAVARHLARCAARAFRPIYKWFMFVLVVDVRRAGRLRRPSAGGLVRADRPSSRTLYYFFHFLILLPVLGKLERPLPLPASIADAVLKKKAG